MSLHDSFNVKISTDFEPNVRRQNNGNKIMNTG